LAFKVNRGFTLELSGVPDSVLAMLKKWTLDEVEREARANKT